MPIKPLAIFHPPTIERVIGKCMDCYAPIVNELYICWSPKFNAQVHVCPDCFRRERVVDNYSHYEREGSTSTFKETIHIPL